MRRVVFAGILLLFLGWYSVRAGSHGAAFSYKGISNGSAWLEPMVVPQFAVQLKSGPREINKAEVLTSCIQDAHSEEVTDAAGMKAKVSQFTLTCGDRVFVIVGLHFQEF